MSIEEEAFGAEPASQPVEENENDTPFPTDEAILAKQKKRRNTRNWILLAGCIAIIATILAVSQGGNANQLTTSNAGPEENAVAPDQAPQQKGDDSQLALPEKKPANKALDEPAGKKPAMGSTMPTEWALAEKNADAKRGLTGEKADSPQETQYRSAETASGKVVVVTGPQDTRSAAVKELNQVEAIISMMGGSGNRAAEPRLSAPPMPPQSELNQLPASAPGAPLLPDDSGTRVVHSNSFAPPQQSSMPAMPKANGAAGPQDAIKGLMETFKGVTGALPDAKAKPASFTPAERAQMNLNPSSYTLGEEASRQPDFLPAYTRIPCMVTVPIELIDSSGTLCAFITEDVCYNGRIVIKKGQLVFGTGNGSSTTGAGKFSKNWTIQYSFGPLKGKELNVTGEARHKDISTSKLTVGYHEMEQGIYGKILEDEWERIGKIAAIRVIQGITQDAKEKINSIYGEQSKQSVGNGAMSGAQATLDDILARQMQLAENFKAPLRIDPGTEFYIMLDHAVLANAVGVNLTENYETQRRLAPAKGIRPVQVLNEEEK